MTSSFRFANSKDKIIVRNAVMADAQAICDLTTKAYADSGMKGYEIGAVIGQINHFPAGQFVIAIADKRGFLVECRRRQFPERHSNRLRTHRGVGLLRLRVPGIGAASDG